MQGSYLKVRVLGSEVGRHSLRLLSSTLEGVNNSSVNYWVGLLAGAAPKVHAGGSGYFSKPTEGLDPRLFSGENLLPEVRHYITSTLYDFWANKYSGAPAWSTVWIAGSGISYQWSAGRGNGDLDILIGVDFPTFFAANPKYRTVSDDEMVAIFNAEFHASLWPSTAEHTFASSDPATPDGVFEVTYFVNTNSADIRDINPYAAYNVSNNSWTVKPPVLPEDPHTLYAQEWFDSAKRDEATSADIIGRYKEAKERVGDHTNAVHDQSLALADAHALYSSIHLGRKAAFKPGGKGYGDYANFRWQRSKDKGYGPALNELVHYRSAAETENDRHLYGGPIQPAADALRAAALWRS